MEGRRRQSRYLLQRQVFCIFFFGLIVLLGILFFSGPQFSSQNLTKNQCLIHLLFGASISCLLKKVLLWFKPATATIYNKPFLAAASHQQHSTSEIKCLGSDTCLCPHQTNIQNYLPLVFVHKSSYFFSYKSNLINLYST